MSFGCICAKTGFSVENDHSTRLAMHESSNEMALLIAFMCRCWLWPIAVYVLPNRTIQRTFKHRELSLCNDCILCRQSECFNAFLALESNEDWTVNMYFGVAVNTKSWSKNLQVVHCAIRRKCWFHCMLSSIAKYVNKCASCANKKPYYTLFLFHKPQIRQTKSHKLKLFVFLRMRVSNRSLALAHCYNIWIGEALP